MEILVLVFQPLVNSVVLGTDCLVGTVMLARHGAVEPLVLFSSHRILVRRFVFGFQILVFRVVLAFESLVRTLVLLLQLFMNRFMFWIVGEGHHRKRN